MTHEPAQFWLDYNIVHNVWEAFWDGYEPDGPDEQPFLAAIAPNRRDAYRKLIGNMLEVHRQGVDYPARVVRRCRHHGISPWISLRMNDVHENDNLEHPFHSDLWRKPNLLRQGHAGYYARALDYAHAEVRDHYRALVMAIADRHTDRDAPDVSVNGVAGKLRSNEPAKNGNRQLIYSIPLSAVSGRNKDTITITSADERSITVFRVEVRLSPPINRHVARPQ